MIFIWFGAMDATKPYEFKGFGAMDATKPYEFIGSGAMEIYKVWYRGQDGSGRASRLPQVLRSNHA